MRFREIATRLTGFSVPMFGVSWNPPEAQRSVARRVLAFLEDRRVLYVSSEAECPDHCVQSVIEIRHFLTQEIGALSGRSKVAQPLMAMRAACRKFLNTVQVGDGRIVRFGASSGHYASWIFLGALGELRGVFGIHIAALATRYGLNVEDDLSSIFPISESE